MKKLYVFMVIVIMSLLMGCGTENKAESVLSRVHRTHVIRAAVVIDSPMVIKNPTTGEYSGHLVDTMKVIAETIHARIEWQETTYGNAGTTLQSGRADVIVAPLFANVERAQSIAFTEPVLYMGLSALVKKGGRFENVSSVSEFDQPNVTIALATGEAGDLFAKAQMNNAKLVRNNVEAADISRFMLDVVNGNADVAIADANQIAKFAATHPGVVDLFATKQFALNPASFAVRYGDPDWLRFMDTSLHFLKTRGVLLQLEKKYGANWQHELKE